MQQQRQQILEYFQRFYNLVIQPRLTNTVADSQWNYFNTLMMGNNFDHGRIELYLSILEGEKKAKKEDKKVQKQPQVTPVLRNKQENQIHQMRKTEPAHLEPEMRKPNSHKRNESIEDVKLKQAMSMRDPDNHVHDTRMIRSFDDNGQLSKMMDIAARLLTVFEETQAQIR